MCCAYTTLWYRYNAAICHAPMHPLSELPGPVHHIGALPYIPHCGMPSHNVERGPVHHIGAQR